ncbi:MAG: DNA-directed RNA polymerase subunit omega [Holosporaceae bacterium]|nr:DNA-directed RNA polymerase subunit omega [Holosporaceae bacterium]
MARVTVEDCEKVVANRFDLVVLAAQRTRQILSGNKITLESDDEKKHVIALREIAAMTVSVDYLKESAIKSFRSFTPEEDLDEDIEDLPEEDTYNPCVEMEMAAIESGNIRIVDGEEEFEEAACDDANVDDEDASERGDA